MQILINCNNSFTTRKSIKVILNWHLYQPRNPEIATFDDGMSVVTKTKSRTKATVCEFKTNLWIELGSSMTSCECIVSKSHIPSRKANVNNVRYNYNRMHDLCCRSRVLQRERRQ